MGGQIRKQSKGKRGGEQGEECSEEAACVKLSSWLISFSNGSHVGVGGLTPESPWTPLLSP